MLQRSPYRMTNMNLAHRGFGLNDGGKNGECQNHRQFIVHTFNGGQKLIQVAVNLPIGCSTRTIFLEFLLQLV